MPNWCENNLSVIGDENEIRRFCETGLITVVEKNGDIKQEWSLEPYYPYPDGNWDHDWCVKHWGTKWDANYTFHECDKNSFFVRFLSAYNPPVDWLHKVQQDYPTLKFKLTYIEVFESFCGIAFTEIKDENKSTFIGDYRDDCREFVNEDDEPITYDEEREEWILDSTGEVMDEDEFTMGRNHYEDFKVWFETEVKVENNDELPL